MIGSIALLSALLAATPAGRPRESFPHRGEIDLDELAMPDFHLDFEMPDLDLEMPDLDFSQFRMDELKALRQLRNLDLLAQRDEDDAEEDEEREPKAGAMLRRLSQDAEDRARHSYANNDVDQNAHTLLAS